MKIITWNVNGIRARQAQVLELIANEQPDVLCLQELKAKPEQIPEELSSNAEYWSYWHGAAAYSGVSLHLRKQRFADAPAFHHPPFDHETRIVAATVAGITYASVYVPNGGKDYDAKLAFFNALLAYSGELHQQGGQLILCGDINIAREERDVHPKERKPSAIGQRAEERELFQRLLATGLVDVGRHLHPDSDDLFTWWAPWRNLRQRNIGWRIDYVLASHSLAERAVHYASQREVGTSDHAPSIATFKL